ncbi:hypothetical protein [Bradyrhizobium canariense]|nr:hypothetical protein [Bradyrhizobium canariense]
MLAEAEMWHHKAQEEIASRFKQRTDVSPAEAVTRRTSDALDDSQLLAS